MMYWPVIAACCTFIYFYAQHFMPWVETREDCVRYEDRILNAITPKDFSIANSVTLYASMCLLFWEHAWTVESFTLLLTCHTLVFMARCFCLYMVPLEAPDGYIALRDPMVDWATNSRDEPLSRDLLFSGHMAFVTVNLVMCTVPTYWWIHAYCCMMIPIFLIWQHVHYTIDVFIAPFVAYTCCASARYILLMTI